MEEFLLVVIVAAIVFSALYRRNLQRYNMALADGVKFSLRFIRGNRVFFVIAVIVPIIADFLGSGESLLRQRAYMPRFGCAYDAAAVKFSSKPYDLDHAMMTLRRTAEVIANPLPFSVSGSVFLLFCLILIPFYSIIIRRIDARVDAPTPDYERGIASFCRLLKYTSWFFFPVFVISAAALAVCTDMNSCFPQIKGILLLVVLPLNVAVLSIIHQYFVHVIAGERDTAVRIFEEFPRIFNCVIAVVIIACLPTLIQMAAQFIGMISPGIMASKISSIANASKPVFSVIMMLMLLVPVMAVAGKTSFLPAVKENVKLVKGKWLLYCYVLCCGFLALFLVGMAYDFLFLSYHIGGWSCLIDPIYASIRSVILALFYVCFVKTVFLDGDVSAGE